ncbi:MAG: VWA domain-containing protein [Ferruginibacter sp.]|nr:VWA domain-containing protein [Ferruginibacter sp.]
MFSFQHPQAFWLLLLLLPLVALYRYAVQRKRAVAKKIGDDALVAELTASYLPRRYALKAILSGCACTLIVLAIANPRLSGGNQTIKRNGIDLVLALDVSNSMLAEDVSPSRLDRARHVMYRMVDRLSNHRIAIVVFAGKAYLQMPMTADHTAAKMYINAAGPELVSVQGTALREALKRSSQSFNPQDKKYKAVILITDGEDHDDGAVDEAETMAKEGIVVNTIGIGSKKGAVIKNLESGEVKLDAEGNPVISILNESVLQKMAKAGNGTYHFYTQTIDAVQAMEESIQQMEQREIVDESSKVYQSLYMFPLLAAMLLWMLELFISDKRKRMEISLKPALILLLTMGWGNGFAQHLRKGNALYGKGEYEKAAEQYKQAIEKKNDFAAHFNYGNAMYKSKQSDAALNAYRAAIDQSDNPQHKAAAWYNTGVALQQAGKTEECIEAYKQVLKLAPDDAEARHNLQKALREKQKQQQQKQQQQKKQPQPPKQQQPSSPAKLTQKEAEDKLRALQQQERNLQDKLKKQDPTPAVKPEKDW